MAALAVSPLSMCSVVYVLCVKNCKDKYKMICLINVTLYSKVVHHPTEKMDCLHATVATSPKPNPIKNAKYCKDSINKTSSASWHTLDSAYA